MDYESWSDQDLVDEIDERQCAQTEWEEGFVEDIIKQTYALTPKQRDKIIELLRRDDEQD